eukprot:353511-Chlamydomonas_euryale.AAC.4
MSFPNKTFHSCRTTSCSRGARWPVLGDAGGPVCAGSQRALGNGGALGGALCRRIHDDQRARQAAVRERGAGPRARTTTPGGGICVTDA